MDGGRGKAWIASTAVQQTKEVDKLRSRRHLAPEEGSAEGEEAVHHFRLTEVGLQQIVGKIVLKDDGDSYSINLSLQ